MITDPEDFFAKGCGRCARFDTADCSARQWGAGLLALRALCREAGMVEVAKWGHPVYMHGGRNIALIGATRGDFRMSFMDAALIEDPDGVLELPGPHSRVRSMLRFTDTAAPAAMAPVIRDFLGQLKRHAEAGTRAPVATAERELPEELVFALDSDPVLAEAFFALTPGRRNSYAVAIAQAKQPATRMARIGKYRDRILAGKGATER